MKSLGRSLDVEVSAGVAWVTIDHPPLNLMDEQLIREIEALPRTVEANDDVRVAVLGSADPDFFICHVDATRILLEPAGELPNDRALGRFHRMIEAFRQSPTIWIGLLEGRARGGGAELLAALDMRFGSLESAVIEQPEVATGLIPGGGGSTLLPGIVGRGRALEIILGCHDIDAAWAEQIGFLNRALPSEQIRAHVRALAERIASFPAIAVALAKQAVGHADELPRISALLREEALFHEALASPLAKDRLEQFLDGGGQTRAIELDLADYVATLNLPRSQQ
ncbi:enoyl-CoA hydratase/isomerase family protein [Mycolicibacterium sp.]|uniref:enoyl-CoA hydratase/isomerase family protein n=1 Tax=Mycolicibacterium sp. TaxID=2320850 RepID=UPI0037C7F7D2